MNSLQIEFSLSINKFLFIKASLSWLVMCPNAWHSLSLQFASRWPRDGWSKVLRKLMESQGCKRDALTWGLYRSYVTAGSNKVRRGGYLVRSSTTDGRFVAEDGLMNLDINLSSASLTDKPLTIVFQSSNIHLSDLILQIQLPPPFHSVKWTCKQKLMQNSWCREHNFLIGSADIAAITLLKLIKVSTWFPISISGTFNRTKFLFYSYF